MNNERDPADRRRFHIDKTISVGHIITTITIAGSALMWGMRMETRISLLEQSATRQAEVDRRQDATQDDTSKTIREELKSISNKLDRVIENGFLRRPQ